MWTTFLLVPMAILCKQGFHLQMFPSKQGIIHVTQSPLFLVVLGSMRHLLFFCYKEDDNNGVVVFFYLSFAT
jgi:hypothetical protein